MFRGLYTPLKVAGFLDLLYQNLGNELLVSVLRHKCGWKWGAASHPFTWGWKV